MADMRQKAVELADAAMPRAAVTGTAELYRDSINMVVDLAVALGCNVARATGQVGGNGILFEARGRARLPEDAGNPGRFTFFARRPRMADGVVALAVSDDAVGARGPDLRRLLGQLATQPGVAVPVAGKNSWPAVGFRTLDEGRDILRSVAEFLLEVPGAVPPTAESTVDPRVLRYIAIRRGQFDFRQRLLAAYEGRCAITGCDVVEALEAAHIVPYAKDGAYALSNGLLLRADIHTLFDLHLVSICPDSHLVQLNPRLLPAYAHFDGRPVARPHEAANLPERGALKRHMAIWQSLL